jgi:peptide/nickel transport system permease protein
MLRYTLKQLINMGATLLVVSFLVFALNELTPGDVARKLLGPYATQDQVDKLYTEMGLDRPLLVRYAEYMGKALTGDFGQSIVFRRPVAEVLWDRLGNTLVLAAVSFAVIVPVSILFGCWRGCGNAVPWTARSRRSPPLARRSRNSRWACF